MRGVDADVGSIQDQKTAHHEAGAGEQDKRERQLGNDERAGPSPRAGSRRSGAAAFFQHVVQVRPRDVQRRRKTERDAGGHAREGEEREHARVEREHHPVRLAHILRHRVERLEPKDRQAKADKAADEGEQHAFDEQLPDHLQARGAYREADPDLPGAIGGSRQQQVRHIRAGNQQHEDDRAHQRPEHGANGAAVDRAEPVDERRQPFIFFGIVALKLGANRRHFRLCLLEGHAICQPAEHNVVVDRTVPLGNALQPLCLRQPKLGVERKLHDFGHHADDGGRQAVQPHDLADDILIATVAFFPHCVGEHQDRRCARAIILRTKVAADDGVLIQHPKDVDRDVRTEVLLGRTVLFAHAERAEIDECHARKAVRRCLPVLEVRERDAVLPALRILRAEGDNLLGLVERNVGQQHCVDDGEDRHVRADSQRESHDGGQSEPAAFHKQADAEAEVVPQRHKSFQLPATSFQL